MKGIPIVALAALLLLPCKNALADKLPSTADSDALAGTWAMIPLGNGIANVVEFTREGKSTLHAFNCSDSSAEAPEVSDYQIRNDGETIHVSSLDGGVDLEVLYITKIMMKLATKIDGKTLKFTYLRVNEVRPRCDLYAAKPAAVPVKGTPFSDADFSSDPFVPDHPNIERFVGRWAFENGAVQIEVIRDANGKVRLNPGSNESWSFLYNEVMWVGDELSFQEFTYSRISYWFDHPFHKSRTKLILAPVNDSNKIKYSIVRGEERSDSILIKIP